MADIVIGTSKGLELFVRDADGDETFDEGERIGVRGPGDRFETARVNEALGSVAISGVLPGARIHRIGAYIDFINQAEQCLNTGEYRMAGEQLEQAVAFASANGITVDRERIADMRWRAIDAAIEAHDPGLALLNDKDVDVLARDDSVTGRFRSAAMILDFLSLQASIRNVARSDGAGTDRHLEELNGEAGELRSAIAGRTRRIRTVLATGVRSTVAEQTSESGLTFRVGDYVRYRDPESGDFWGADFVITGFDISADGIIARGEETPSRTSSESPHRVDIECLAHVTVNVAERVGPRPAEPGSESDGWVSRLGESFRRLLSRMPPSPF